MKNKALHWIYKLAEWLSDERLLTIFSYIAFFFLVMLCGVVAAD